MKMTVKLLVFLVSIPAFALPPLKVERGRLVDAVTKQPVWLFGVNLFESHLGWTISQDINEMERNLLAIARFGFNALRVPLNMSYIEPAPNVFPDNPRYAEIMRQHNLKEGFPHFLDTLVKKAGELGMYVILEFHELPTDPWRYFAGGNEQLRGTGQHGGAIAWLAKITEEDGKIEKVELDWDKAYEYVPKALAWLARRYKGNPILAGIEVPWNEPVGGWAEDEKLYYRLVQACARAVKKEDPTRLVFMNVQDWGAGINFLPSSSTWRTPPEVDVLSPHFYFGMHCPNTPYKQALRCAVANWTSWFTGWGKPVVVGEYGTHGLTRDWLEGHSKELGEFSFDSLANEVIGACLKQWKEMGVQGVLLWAWWGGIPASGIGKGRDLRVVLPALEQFVRDFKKPRLTSIEAKVAVICDIKRRSQYGDPQDLLAISDVLVSQRVLPFHTVFAQAFMEEKSFLEKRNYEKIILLADGLSEEIIKLVKGSVPKERLFVIQQERASWREELLKFLGGTSKISSRTSSY